MRIINGPTFTRQLKQLAKRHRSLVADVLNLVADLQIDPQQGQPIGDVAKGCYKIKLAISSKGKGKRGSARVITCVQIEGDTIYLLSIYDKTDREDLEDGELEQLLKQIED